MISCSEEPLAGSKNKHRLEAISSFAKRWIQLHYVFFGNGLPLAFNYSAEGTKNQESNFIKIYKLKVHVLDCT